MIRKGLAAVCLFALFLTAGFATITGKTALNRSVGAKNALAQDTIDVSAPLHDMFYTTTTMGITPGVDLQGNPIYTTNIPVPNYDQANVVWQLSFDQVQFDSLSAADNQQNYANLQQLQAAISSGSLTSLDVSFLDNFNGEATFGGFTGSSQFAELDRTGAMNVLLSPVQSIIGDTTLGATGFVSASSLGLANVPMFLDGRIDSAFNPPAPMPAKPPAQTSATSATPTTASEKHRGRQKAQRVQQQQVQQQQQAQLQWGGCSVQLGCATPAGFVCPVQKFAITWLVICNGVVTGRFTTMPTNIGVNCRIQIQRGVQWMPGACNWTIQGWGRRRHWVCICI